MANPEHVEIIKQGVDVWNTWREANAHIRPDLRGGNLINGDFRGANLTGVDLSGSNLYHAHMSDADLSDAILTASNLDSADLSRANLCDASMVYANLYQTKFREASLVKTNMGFSVMHWTDFRQATLSGCVVYGISAWNLNLDGAKQEGLIITDIINNEPAVTVDNLEIAQFVYLLLKNNAIRSIIDTITTKAVLILGRFTEERKQILNMLREELGSRNYVPILFDFDKPANRDLTETVSTLAHMARFVIADLSDPHSIPHELMSFARDLPSVPVQAIFTPVPEHEWEYPMFEHLSRYAHVLPIHEYEDLDDLIASLPEKVIGPAEAKAEEMKPPKLW